MMIRRLAMPFFAAAAIAGAVPAFAQHLAQTQGLAAQSYFSYTDVSLTAAAAAVQNPCRKPRPGDRRMPEHRCDQHNASR
jgi:hypothetical protein